MFIKGTMDECVFSHHEIWVELVQHSTISDSPNYLRMFFEGIMNECVFLHHDIWVEWVQKVIVSENISHYLKFNVSPDEMRHMCRYGNSPGDPRLTTVKVRFKDIDLKNEILRLRSRLSGTRIKMREHLTLCQSDIYNQAKLARKNDLMSSTWTTNGFTFALGEMDSAPTLIHDLKTLKVQKEAFANGEMARDTVGEAAGANMDTL